MKRYQLLFIFLVIAFACDTTSNIKPPGRNYFVKYFGGDGNQTAVGLIANSDGTFFILGNSRVVASDTQKVYLAKADAQGNLIWQTTYGDAELEARDFAVSNGVIVVAANRAPGPGSIDKHIQLIQFTQDGVASNNVILQIPQQPSSVTRANSISVLSNGDFLVSGNTGYVGGQTSHSQDALHFRTDKNLTQRAVLWQNTYGQGISNNEVRAFQYLDSIYVFGHTDFPNLTDQNFWAFSLHNSTGATDGNSDDPAEFVINGSDEIVTSAQKAIAGGYLMTGYSIDNSQNQTLKIIKLRSNILDFKASDIQFNYPGRSLGQGSTPFATACNASSGYLVLANSNSAETSSDMMLIKLDYALREVWNSPAILGGDGKDMVAAVAELPDGHIIVLGTMNLGKPAEQYKITLMKLNSQGKLTD